MKLALVLGGGGSAAVGWEIGVLAALAEVGLDLRSADTLIGTSAGSIVSLQLASGADLAELYDHVRVPPTARPSSIDYPAVARSWAAAVTGATSAEDGRRRIGALALAARTMSAPERRAEVAALLPPAEPTWPERPLLVCAVNALSGAFVTFSRDSGMDLLDAVGASCAVPGVWPPVLIDDEPYIDGAVRSPTNAPVAQGHDAVLVLAPLSPPGGLAAEARRLAPALVQVIEADAGSLAAFGSNPLDPTVAPAAATQGHRQGLASADEVARLLATDRH